jgi:4-hydroxybutyrate CoA-transferase
MSRCQDVCGDKLISVEDALEVIRPGQTVGIAEVDEDHIVTYGENYIHLSQLDYLVEKQGDSTLGDVASVMGYEAPSAVDLQMAAYAADLIRDGDTLQIGASTVSMAVIPHLHEKNDLGLHSELCPLIHPKK